MESSLRDRTAIVTGAGRREGIGFHVCRTLARLGARVRLTARDGRAAAQRAQELASEGLSGGFFRDGKPLPW